MKSSLVALPLLAVLAWHKVHKVLKNGIETVNTFIHTRSSLENHTRFQTEMGKVRAFFSDQNRSKTLPSGAAYTYLAYIRE